MINKKAETSNILEINNKISSKKNDDGFANYIKEIQKFPILTSEQEFDYAIRFAEQNDLEAGKMLIQSHLRLVIKIAKKFKNYGLPASDLVAEGNIGLLQALKKFEPRKGFRFSTYAMWWIRAFIQDYVLKSWSLVRISTGSAHKKLFFNLNKIKRKLGINNPEIALSDDGIKNIAQTLNVDSKDVIEMNSRLTQFDGSLNHKINDGEATEIADIMTDNAPSQEEIAIENQEKNRQKALFRMAFEKLNEREQEIICKRQLNDDTQTLEELSQHFKVSRERIRQIEENAIRKLKKFISETIAINKKSNI
jgi:RNA polymerase sigma-32 factor